MESYKSQYPTLRQAKTRWSSKAIVAKQGEGPAHDWYEMLKKDARAKLAASIRASKLGHVREEVEDDQHLYHVTHTKHVAKIQKHGLKPMQTSNWVKAGDKERYGSGEVYTFTHHADAHAWAGRMDWAHHQKLGSGNISIIKLKKPENHEFEQDHNDPLSQAGAKGKWMKTNKPIDASHIVSVTPYSPKKLGEDKVGKPSPSVNDIAAKHNLPVADILKRLAKGIETEKEHTNDESEAAEIARDHMHEFPDYYDRLDKMEKKAKAEVSEAIKARRAPRKKQTKKDWQAVVRKLNKDDPKAVRKALIAHGKLSEGYDPDVAIIKGRIEAHKSLADKMAKEHGEKSHQAAFHRELVRRMEKELKEDLQEDVANSVGGGNIAGMPTADSADMTPVRKPMNPLRRKTFAGKAVFVVDPTTYHKAHLGKRKYEHYEKYLEGCDIAEEIREFGRKNWADPIIIQNEQTGAMVYLKYGSK